MKHLIKNYLEENKFYFQTINIKETRTLYSMGMALENGDFEVYININTEPKLVSVNTYFPVKIPAEYFNKISEFITRVNYLMFVGNFVLDYNTGDLYYKTSFLYNNVSDEYNEVFHLNLVISYQNLDKYIPAIMSIIYADTDPKTAFIKIENIIKPELN
jgi:hypothetical protein